MKKINWEKIFRIGDKINKDIKLTEAEILNMVKGTTTQDSTYWVELLEREI